MILDTFNQTNGFITQWTVSGNAAARTITLPLVQNRTEGALSYNCVIDWGDGSALSTVTAYNDPNRIHTYASNGTYNVEIRGTCEGWSFNGGGDCNKIVKIIYWGDAGGFNGFKYLMAGFASCINLTSLGIGTILASGTGVLTDGFFNVFYSANITSVPVGLFNNHPNVTTNAFSSAFAACTSLTNIPAGLFDVHTMASTNGFTRVFSECNLISIPTDLFRHNTLVSTSGFDSAFQFNNNIAALPVDLFRYNALVSSGGFVGTFKSCGHLTTLPSGLFRYNTLVSSNGFDNAFNGCIRLASVPSDLFRYNALATGFNGTFYGCSKLQVNDTVFFGSGEEATRFLNQSPDFTQCFYRTSFTGTQGIAPDAWNCNFGTGTPTTTQCFGGTGNSLASLSNYASIPGAWE